MREIARRALLPIQPAHAGTDADRTFLFSATRTNAGRKLPPYYLVYFLLVDLLGFANLGRFEKLAWSVPIDFNGTAFLIEHRKFGLGVFAQEGEGWEREAEKIVGLIHRGARAAKPLFKWMADEAVAKSKLNVHNVGRQLFSRYVFLRDEFRTATAEIEALKATHQTERRQRELGFHPYSIKATPDANLQHAFALFTTPWIKRSRDASWLALAAIDAFFSWTEHILIHLAILQGQVSTGAQVAQMAEADWAAKFKCAFNISEKTTKIYFDRLITIRRQLRNFMAHGAFGKGGEAFSFHSHAGAVPVALDHTAKKPRFSLTPEFAFNDAEAIAALEEFIVYLWSGLREPARIYIQETDLPLILPHASDGTYTAAMASVADMTEFVDHQLAEWDRATNMDW